MSGARCLTVLLVNSVAPHDDTNGQMVGTLVAAAAGHNTYAVMLPSTMEVNASLLPDGLGAEAAAAVADKAGAEAGAPVGVLATTLIPVAGVVQPRGLWIVGTSPVAMFLIQVKL